MPTRSSRCRERGSSAAPAPPSQLIPPLIEMTCPVMYPASCDARNRTRLATSSAEPARFIGTGRDGVDGDPAARDLEAQSLRRGVQGALGRCVIHLATIADQGADRGDVDHPTPARANHRQYERLGHVIEPVDRDIDDALPFERVHPGKHGVIMDAGVVDQDLNGRFLEQRFEHRPRRRAIGHIEGDAARLCAGRYDLAHQFRGGVGISIGVHVDEVARRRKTSADGRAEPAAAAGHQGAYLAHEPDARSASRTTVARPSRSAEPSQARTNSYEAAPWLEASRTASQIKSPGRSSSRVA